MRTDGRKRRGFRPAWRAWLGGALAVALLGALALAGYRWALAQVRTDIYDDRLAGLADEYRSLRARYNQAVRRTAVTELIVTDGRLSVVIRTIEGVVRTIETPYDPTDEIYCDYVLTGGRLWIRRVYDAQTPPSKGLVISDRLAEVDWDDPAARYGKAVYRSLSEGRWVVTVTGDGSLGLARIAPETALTLAEPPPVRDYEEIDRQIRRDIGRITVGDVFRHVFAAKR